MSDENNQNPQKQVIFHFTRTQQPYGVSGERRLLNEDDAKTLERPPSPLKSAGRIIGEPKLDEGRAPIKYDVGHSHHFEKFPGFKPGHDEAANLKAELASLKAELAALAAAVSSKTAKPPKDGKGE